MCEDGVSFSPVVTVHSNRVNFCDKRISNPSFRAYLFIHKNNTLQGGCAT